MTVRIVRLGTPRAKDEGLRIGTVRRPPRGVPKSQFASGNWYDVWFPNLAPSADIVKIALDAQKQAAQGVQKGMAQSAIGDKEWSAFTKKYRAEMARPEAAHDLDLLAALSKTADFSVGCYCEDESRCHRSVLRELLKERGAKVV